jgi:hypothetical protein
VSFQSLPPWGFCDKATMPVELPLSFQACSSFPLEGWHYAPLIKVPLSNSSNFSATIDLQPSQFQQRPLLEGLLPLTRSGLYLISLRLKEIAMIRLKPVTFPNLDRNDR